MENKRRFEETMKLLLPILSCFCMTYSSAKGPILPTYLQPYAGMSAFHMKDGAWIKSFQTGVTYSPFNGLLFLSLENNHSYASKKSEWVGVGQYKYVRNYNNLGLTVGMRFWRTHRFNVACGAKIYLFNMNGKPKGGNEEIRKYVNTYQNSGINVCNNIQLNYLLSVKFSIYANISRVRTAMKDSYIEFNHFGDNLVILGGSTVVGFGIAYNFYAL